ATAAPGRDGLDGARRVAGGRVAAVVARLEPMLSLLRRAVRPGVGLDLALRRLLDAVVADGLRRVHGVRDLRRGDRLEEAGAGGMVGPHAGEAVGLELGPDRRATRAD